MILKDGFPFILVALVVAVILALVLGPYWAIPPVVLMLYFAYFFRNPDRQIKCLFSCPFSMCTSIVAL